MRNNTIYNIDCLVGLRDMLDNSIDLCVTSPPYYNARKYSHWNSLSEYMEEMECIFTELYRCMKNHRYIVINVGDIVSKSDKQVWTTKKIPLGAMFVVMLQGIGFDYQDDFIWDKGEPQSKRHIGNPQYPFYQYPINCYEHILIFSKNELDKTKLACPVCNEYVVVSNGLSKGGIQSWECKNLNCKEKSLNGRGKRFSAKSIMMNDYQLEKNHIDKQLINKWRRDIVKINPVIKINSKGENILGHSAPFPKEIPQMAIQFFSGVGDLVVDIFSGSATTLIEAKKLNRTYLGYELDREYYELSLKRLREYEE